MTEKNIQIIQYSTIHMLIHFPPKTIHFIHFMKIFMVNSVHKKSIFCCLWLCYVPWPKTIQGGAPSCKLVLKKPLSIDISTTNHTFLLVIYLHQQLAFTNWGTTFLGFLPSWWHAIWVHYNISLTWLLQPLFPFPAQWIVRPFGDDFPYKPWFPGLGRSEVVIVYPYTYIYIYIS